MGISLSAGDPELSHMGLAAAPLKPLLGSITIAGDAGFPPLALRLRQRGDRPQLRRALRVSRLRVRYRGDLPKKFPERYGVAGDYMPDGFVRQQLFPFRGITKPAAATPDGPGRAG